MGCKGHRLTGGRGSGGLVVLGLARLPEHAVDLQHVHPLAQLVLELRQPLLCGDLLPGQPLHLMFIFLLLPLQGLWGGRGTMAHPECSSSHVAQGATEPLSPHHLSWPTGVSGPR